MSRAYLILQVHGSASSVKSASTSKTAEGESGMSSGFPSLRRSGTSQTNHAALLVSGLPEEGQGVYLSFYPAGGGFFANGAFIGVETDDLFEGSSAARRIYRIDGLKSEDVATYLRDLNAHVQRQILIKALENKLLNPSLSPEKRGIYEAELVVQRAQEKVGYNAFNHNCTTVTVAALRAGGLIIPGALLATPSWLDGVARADTTHYHGLTLEEFTAELRHAAATRVRAGADEGAGVGVGAAIAATPYTIVRPHAAFAFEPMARLGAELLGDRYKVPVSERTPITEEEMAAAETAREAREQAQRSALPARPAYRRVVGLGGDWPGRRAGTDAGAGAGAAAASAPSPSPIAATVRSSAVPAVGDLILSGPAGAGVASGGLAAADSSASGKDEAHGEDEGGSGLGPR